MLILHRPAAEIAALEPEIYIQGQSPAQHLRDCVVTRDHPHCKQVIVCSTSAPTTCTTLSGIHLENFLVAPKTKSRPAKDNGVIKMLTKKLRNQ